MPDITEACAKLARLSEARAQRVLSLIDDLAELEALEEAEDILAARKALAEYDQTGKSISLQELEEQSGL